MSLHLLDLKSEHGDTLSKPEDEVGELARPAMPAEVQFGLKVVTSCLAAMCLMSFCCDQERLSL